MLFSQGSRVELTGGAPRRHCGSGCTMTVIAGRAMTTVTAAVAATMTVAANNNDSINKDDNDDNNIDDNEDKDNGRPGNDGCRQVEENIAIMVLPQAGKRLQMIMAGQGCPSIVDAGELRGAWRWCSQMGALTGILWVLVVGSAHCARAFLISHNRV
jgi:hypothetical protein